jgi:hypothetical protein
LISLLEGIFLKFGNDVLIVLVFFEGVDGFGEFLDFLNQVLIFLSEEFVFLFERLIIKFDKVDINAHLLALENKLSFALKLLPQEVILPDNVLRILLEILPLLLGLLNLLLKQRYLMLVGHKQGLDIIKLLQHFSVVDFRDVLRRTQFLDGEA